MEPSADNNLQKLEGLGSNRATELEEGHADVHKEEHGSGTVTTVIPAPAAGPTKEASFDETGSGTGAPSFIPFEAAQVEPARSAATNNDQTPSAVAPAMEADQTDLEAATEAPALQPAGAQRSTAKTFTLPLPPPVAPFKRQHSSESVSHSATPHAPALPSNVEPASREAASSQADEPPLPRAPAESGGAAVAEAAAAGGEKTPAPRVAATDEELLALAEEVRRLEEELAAAQGAAQRSAEQMEAARAEASSAQEEAAEWEEREADARAEVGLQSANHLKPCLGNVQRGSIRSFLLHEEPAGRRGNNTDAQCDKGWISTVMDMQSPCGIWRLRGTVWVVIVHIYWYCILC